MTDELISNGVTLDMFENIPVPVTYSIADVTNPQNRKQTISKEVILPDTATNRAYFIGAYGLTTTDNGVTFDPSAKAEVILKKRGIQVLDGLLKLDRVDINNRTYSFVCRVLSDSIDIFQLLSTINVSDLDWSAYAHTLTRTNIKNTWAATAGTGYYYPLIERGLGRPAPTIWRTVDFMPYVYLYEAIQKALEWADVTFDSAFLETTMFKNILFGYGGGILGTISPADVTERKIEIDSGDCNMTVTVLPTALNPISPDFGQGMITQLVIPNANPFDDAYFTSTETTDALDQYDNGEIEIQKTGNYTLAIACILDYVIDDGANQAMSSFQFPTISVLKNGAPFYDITSSTTTYTSLTGTIDFDTNATKNIYVQAGDTISFRIRFGVAYTFLTAGFPPDIIELVATTNTDITIDLTSIDTTVTDGGDVNMSVMLPKMKCSDLLLGAIRQFNLYQSEPDLYGESIIEPMIDFYSPTAQFEDITQLIDNDKPITITPSANEYAKEIVYAFKKSNDFDATTYVEKWEGEYGDLNYTQGSYYAKGTVKTEVPWSTIIPYEVSPDIVVPRFIKIDNGVTKPNAGAARIMFRCAMQTGAITLRDTEDTDSEELTEYPLVHHFDDIDAPTMDLNFKLVSEVYYLATQVTTVNCFSEYYSVFINEQTSPAGQLIKLFVKWNEEQMKNRDFGKLIMINGGLFRLNRINDFAPSVNISTETELIKVLKAKKKRRSTFTVSLSALTSPQTIESPSDETGQGTGVIIGSPTTGKEITKING